MFSRFLGFYLIKIVKLRTNHGMRGHSWAPIKGSLHCCRLYSRLVCCRLPHYPSLILSEYEMYVNLNTRFMPYFCLKKGEEQETKTTIPVVAAFLQKTL